MPAKKIITPKTPLPTRSAAASVKRPVAKKVIVRPGASAKAPKTAMANKTAAKPATPSLVNAVPLSNISPQNPQQLLYEPDSSKQDAGQVTSVAAEMPKRGRGRPRKNPVVPPPAAISVEQSPEEGHSLQKSPPAPAMSPAAAPAQHQPATPAAPAAARAHTARRGFRINSRLLTVLTVLIVLVAGGWYWHVAHAEDTASVNAKLLTEIGEHVVLPKGETPTISTVVDATKVNQEFLKNAKKGDKVLLYFQSSQAIVYRPSTGQVVNMGPVQTPRPRVFIRQGSTADNTAAVKRLIGASSAFLVTSQDQSPKKNYDKTIVVDLTGNRPDLAGQLAQLLHVNVGNLPAGEMPPDADLMVIVGSDFK